MRTICGLCLALLPLLAFGAPPQENASDSIRAIVDQLVVAWNHHDAHAFAAVFAADADFTNVIGKGASGRQNIQEFHASVFSTLFKNSHLECSDIKVRLIRPDIAAVDAHWSMTGAVDPSGNPWPNRTGLMNFVATKESGNWQILVFHNMDLPKNDK
jgi:uncharacterized protein (TIGR02246 family)